MAFLYLIRHGEPTVRGLFPGRLDPLLSERGKAEVLRSLASLDVSVVYASPSRRARETAECVAASRLVQLPELREVDYGLWSDQSWQEIERHWSSLAASKSLDWIGVAAADVESWIDVLARAAGVLKTIREAAPAGPVAVVAHQGINSALASLIDRRNPLEFVQAYGEAVRVEYD